MRFYSSGKLLLSGEYLILKGSTALAAPLIRGQELIVKTTGYPDELIWESKAFGNTWFKTKIQIPLFDIIETTDQEISVKLIDHLKAAVQLKNSFKSELPGKNVSTNLEFDLNWGFGSSSSLISNIAYWADVDPYQLHRKVSSGSGYDVICSRVNGPIFFERSGRSYKTEDVDIDENVCRQIYFVYLGKKKHSESSVRQFLKGKKRYNVEMRLISELTRHMAKSSTIEDFGYYMKEHEQILSSVLKLPGLKDSIFSDFNGEAKSLGAWGGDFAMLTWNGSFDGLNKYINKKKLSVLFAFNDLVKKR